MSNLLGAQARMDDVKDIGIGYTFDRRYLSTHQNASVVQKSSAIYFENATQWLPRLRTVVGLRKDWFRFDGRTKW